MASANVFATVRPSWYSSASPLIAPFPNAHGIEIDSPPQTFSAGLRDLELDQGSSFRRARARSRIALSRNQLPVHVHCPGRNPGDVTTNYWSGTKVPRIIDTAVKIIGLLMHLTDR